MKGKKAKDPATDSGASVDGAVKNGHLSGDGIMQLFGIASNDRIVNGGSYGQFRGQQRTAVFTVGINKGLLDGEVKRVGFMGVDNDQALQKEVSPSAEYNNGLWDIEFELYMSMMGETFHRIKGAFFVETVNETYYWLKRRDSNDFEFDGDSRLMLKDF